MQIAWSQAGERAADFWDATPRVFYFVVSGYHRRRGWDAWHSAYLTRIDHKEFPSLSVMTGEPEHRREQSDDEFKRSIAMWRTAFKNKETA